MSKTTTKKTIPLDNRFLEDALAAFEKSLELRPDSPEALYKLGVLYDRKKQPRLAETVYRKGRELGER